MTRANSTLTMTAAMTPVVAQRCPAKTGTSCEGPSTPHRTKPQSTIYSAGRAKSHGTYTSTMHAPIHEFATQMEALLTSHTHTTQSGRALGHKGKWPPSSGPPTQSSRFQDRKHGIVCVRGVRCRSPELHGGRLSVQHMCRVPRGAVGRQCRSRCAG